MSDGRAYGGETPADRDARRRRQLLDAGLEVFGAVGFRRATVRRVCRLAHVADRYFYREFTGLEDLLLAVYDSCTTRLADAVLSGVGSVTAEASPEVAVASGLHGFLACVQGDPALARVVWFEVLGVNHDIEQHHLRHQEQFGELIGALMRERGIDLACSDFGRTVLLRAIAGGISQVTMTWIGDGFRPERQEIVPALVTFTLGCTQAAGDPPSAQRSSPAAGSGHR